MYNIILLIECAIEMKQEKEKRMDVKYGLYVLKDCETFSAIKSKEIKKKCNVNITVLNFLNAININSNLLYMLVVSLETYLGAYKRKLCYG